MFKTTSQQLFPLAISKATFECLTSRVPRPMPEASLPETYHITMQKSECGGYYFFHEAERFSIFVIPPTEANPDGLVLENFFKKLWSNFLHNTGIEWTIHGEPVRFKNAEQVFKSTCVVSHMDPDDDSSANAQLFAKVLEATMSAKSPVECKFAPNAIPKELFQATKWDYMSYYPMYEAQKLKCTGDAYHDHMQFVGRLAKEYGIKQDRIYFTECAGARDTRWGTGLTVDEMTQAVIEHVRDPAWLNMGRPGHPLPFPGKNLLGEALADVSRVVLGDKLQYLGEDVDDYVLRIGTVCPLFVYTPSSSTAGDADEVILIEDGNSPKRARTGSEEEVVVVRRTGSSEEAFDDVVFVGRTGSIEEVVPVGRTGSVEEVAPVGRTGSVEDKSSDIGFNARTVSDYSVEPTSDAQRRAQSSKSDDDEPSASQAIPEPYTWDPAACSLPYDLY